MIPFNKEKWLAGWMPVVILMLTLTACSKLEVTPTLTESDEWNLDSIDISKSRITKIGRVDSIDGGLSISGWEMTSIGVERKMAHKSVGIRMHNGEMTLWGWTVKELKAIVDSAQKSPTR